MGTLLISYANHSLRFKNFFGLIPLLKFLIQILYDFLVIDLVSTRVKKIKNVIII